MDIDKNAVDLRLEDKERLSKLYHCLSTQSRKELLGKFKVDPVKGNTAELVYEEINCNGEPVKAFEGVHFKEFLELLLPVESESQSPKNKQGFLALYDTNQNELFGNFANITRNEMSENVTQKAIEKLSTYLETSKFQILLSFFEHCYVKCAHLRFLKIGRSELKGIIDDMAAYKPFYSKLLDEGRDSYEIEQLWNQLKAEKNKEQLHGLLTGHDDPRLTSFHGQAILGRENEIKDVISFLQSELPSLYLFGTAGVGKTEICKASIKKWLEIDNSSQAFYIKVSEGADLRRLLILFGEALGLDTEIIDKLRSLNDLKGHIKPALYYLDNLESVAEAPEGANFIQELALIPNIKILASSRTDLEGILNNGLQVETLDTNSAYKLFSNNWRGIGGLDENLLKDFVECDLGNHALSIYLTASAARNRTLEEIISLWSAKGTALAKLQASPKRANRHNNLDISFSLTRDFLSSEDGALELWQFLALFDEGIDEQTLAHWEWNSDYKEAILILEEYCVVQKKGSTYRILPPVSRYAIESVKNEQGSGGFNWLNSRHYCFAYFSQISINSVSAPDTEYAIISEKRCAEQSQAIAKFFDVEASYSRPSFDLLYALHKQLSNTYFAYTSSTRSIYEVTAKIFGDSFSYNMLSESEVLKGNLAVAKGYSSKALKIASEVSEASIEYADSLLTCSKATFYAKEYDNSKKAIEEASAIYKSTGAIHKYCTAQINLSCLNEIIDNRNEAKQTLNNVILETEKTSNIKIRAGALSKLSMILVKEGSFTKAREYISEAISIFISLNMPDSLADAYVTYGRLEDADGNLEAAFDMFEKALEIFMITNDKIMEETTLFLKGNLSLKLSCHYVLNEDIQQAKLHAEQALISYSKVNDEINCNIIKVLLANIYEHTGSYKEGIDMFFVAIEYFVKSNPTKINSIGFLNFVELIIIHKVERLYIIAWDMLQSVSALVVASKDYVSQGIMACLQNCLFALIITEHENKDMEGYSEDLFYGMKDAIGKSEPAEAVILSNYLRWSIYESFRKDEKKYTDFMTKQKNNPNPKIPAEKSRIDWVTFWANQLFPK